MEIDNSLERFIGKGFGGCGAAQGLKRLAREVCVGILMVDVVASGSLGGSVKVSVGNFDVNELIGKVRGYVDNLKTVSVGGQKLAVSVEGFSFSVGQSGGKLDLKLGVDLAFTPAKRP